MATTTAPNGTFTSDEEYLDYVLIMIFRIFAWSLLAIMATTTSIFIGMCIKHGIGNWRTSRKIAADLEAGEGDMDVGHALAFQLYRDCPPAYEEGAVGMQKPPAYCEVTRPDAVGEGGDHGGQSEDEQE